MTPLLFDTCVLIDILRGNVDALSFYERSLDDMGSGTVSAVLVSAITVHELLQGMRPKESTQTEHLIDAFTIMPVDEAVARVSGFLGRRYMRSHRLGAGGAIIAATAQVANARLVTCNLKHFPMFPDLERPYS